MLFRSEDSVSADLEEAGRSGACGLITVELDRKPGEEMPRVTLKRIQLFETMAIDTRLRAEVCIADMGTLAALSTLLGGSHGGRGELIAALPIGGGTARVRLGRDFTLDAEIAARIEGLAGVNKVKLSAAEPPRLALVS